MSNLVINNERNFSYDVAPVSHPDPVSGNFSEYFSIVNI